MHEVGCLVIHGLNGDRNEVAPICQFLDSKGYFAYAPQLAGHGCDKKILAYSSFVDWISSVRGGYKYIKEHCYKVIVIGFSMGGLLAINLCAENTDAAGLISIATPIFCPDMSVVLRDCIDGVKNRDFGKAKGYMSGIAKTPTRTFFNFFRLLHKTRVTVSKVTTPLLVLQGKRDGVVKWQSGQWLLRMTSSEVKVLKLYERSTHYLYMDEEREQVYDEMDRFIRLVTWPQTQAISAGELMPVH